MLKRILVSIDGSPLSFRALDYAMALGKAYDSELVLLHVTVPFDLSKLHSYEMEKLEDDIYERVLKKEAAKEKLTTVEKARAEAGALEIAKKKATEAGYYDIVFKEVVDTEPAKTIVKQAGLLVADAIVVGCSGLGMLSSMLLGSVSSEVIINAKCPVIVVR
ncbi:MAG: universal stress protein [Acidaminococcaceae bacterium]